MKIIICIIIFSISEAYSSPSQIQGNPCTTSIRDSPTFAAQYQNDQTITEKLDVVGAIVEYTTKSGTDESQRSTVNLVLSSAASLAGAFEKATGLSAGRIIKSTYTYGWVLVSNVSSTSPSGAVSSMIVYAQNAPKAPWQFYKWIVGPPPTEENLGVPSINIVNFQGNKITVTSQKVAYVIQWKEIKCE